MTDLAQLQSLGLLQARVPRYTSYPTAPVFSREVAAGFQAGCIGRLDPAVPVSVYVHIPFCERLCWFCACRTQGTLTLGPVERYLGMLERWRSSVTACRLASAWVDCTGAAARRRS